MVRFVDLKYSRCSTSVCFKNVGAKDRFLHEVRAVSTLNHPSIVKSFSILPIDELHVLVFTGQAVHARTPACT